MFKKATFVIKLLAGAVLILAALWYLTTQFSSISAKLNQVVSTDIPALKNTLEKNSQNAEQMKAAMATLTSNIATWKDQAESVNSIESDLDQLARKITTELIPKISQFGKGSANNIKEIKLLSQKIDTLSKQYVRFLKIAEDKITVSIPPKWVDELPRRKGTIFAIGISPETNTLSKAQQSAAEQAHSIMATELKRKTFNAVQSTIAAAGTAPPSGIEELSSEFKQHITEAVNELLVDSTIESYWVDPAGYVYALISLPVEKYFDGSKLAILLETLMLTQDSITEALIQDFKNQLQLELLN